MAQGLRWRVQDGRVVPGPRTTNRWRQEEAGGQPAVCGLPWREGGEAHAQLSTGLCFLAFAQRSGPAASSPLPAL